MRLEVVADRVVGQRDECHRGRAVDPAVGQVTTDDDGRGVVRVEAVTGRQGEPVAPGLGDGQRRVLLEQAAMIDRASERSVPEAADRADIRRRYEAILTMESRLTASEQNV